MQPRFFFSYFFVTFLSYIRMISPPPFSKFQRNAHTWWGGKQPEKKRRAISVLLFFLRQSVRFVLCQATISHLSPPFSLSIRGLFHGTIWTILSKHASKPIFEAWSRWLLAVFFIFCTHSSFVRSQFLESFSTTSKRQNYCHGCGNWSIFLPFR